MEVLFALAIVTLFFQWIIMGFGYGMVGVKDTCRDMCITSRPIMIGWIFCPFFALGRVFVLYCMKVFPAMWVHVKTLEIKTQEE